MTDASLDGAQDSEGVKNRLSRLKLEVNHGVTKEQVAALLSRYHWLQICGEGSSVNEMPMEIYEGSRSGWDILFYGNAMCTSSGFFQWLSEPPAFGEDDDGDGKEDLSPDEVVFLGGRGTVIAQAWNVALDCLDIALDNGWKKIHVVSGSKVVQRSIIHNSTLPVSGIALDDRDLKILQAVDKSGITPGSRGPGSTRGTG